MSQGLSSETVCERPDKCLLYDLLTFGDKSNGRADLSAMRSPRKMQTILCQS